jgi:methylenetetrahydrofolate reductase (NADPH)
MPTSQLRDRLRAGRFCFTAELVPPLSADPKAVLDLVAPLRGLVSAVNVTDGAGAKTTMSSLAAAAILAREGIEPVLQLTCRDRNRIALAADLVGAAALGICNLLPLFGDDPQKGDQPEAMPVRDLNTPALIALARGMRDGGTLPTGRKIEPPPDFFIGAADVPAEHDPAGAPPSLAAKLDAGAEFVQTQLCFDAGLARRYVASLDRLGLLSRVKILVGLGPIASLKSALWMKQNLFGVAMPETVLKRLEGARDQQAEGRRICIELVHELRGIPGVAGVHLMAPARPIADVASLVLECTN